ncbi:hypothetical protein [Halorussus aquaticus]|uniref:Tat (Twin-arginine translocation) pathway signal sequence n=1 Tax=Halorussus aquaticus TaxID=2953748 RepID=A0ABD5PYB3_9EURY|nr:hypothetical protein [Halorussus aquaticus]
MDRRSFLTAAGTTLATAMAGCASSSKNSSTVMPDGPVHSTAVSENDIEVSVGQWGRKSEVRYYDSDAGETQMLVAENGAFYALNPSITNIGDEVQSVPSLTDFKLWVSGETYPLLTELPAGVSWDKLRKQDDQFLFGEPTAVQDKIYGGSEIFVDLAYDASVETPYLKWTPNGTVEGEDAVYLECGEQLTG